MGVLAADVVKDIVTEDAVLGISSGEGVRSTVEALRPERKCSITVVQITGSSGFDNSFVNGSSLTLSVAKAYGARYRLLPAPLIVEDQGVRDALLRDPRVRDTLALARRVDMALIGIGTLVPEFSAWLRAGLLCREDLARLRARGAVGDICGWCYDTEGSVLDIEHNHRVIAIEPQALQSIEHVIAVAGGTAQVSPILGALRGGYVKTLVTDDRTAKEVLARR